MLFDIAYFADMYIKLIYDDKPATTDLLDINIYAFIKYSLGEHISTSFILIYSCFIWNKNF